LSADNQLIISPCVVFQVFKGSGCHLFMVLLPAVSVFVLERGQWLNVAIVIPLE